MLTPRETAVLEILAAILAHSRRMLSLAQAENWDELVEQEQPRRALIARLHEAIALPPGGKPQDQAQALILEILNLDTQTQELAGQRMGGIRESFQSMEVSKRLDHAYRCP